MVSVEVTLISGDSRTINISAADSLGRLRRLVSRELGAPNLDRFCLAMGARILQRRDDNLSLSALGVSSGACLTYVVVAA